MYKTVICKVTEAHSKSGQTSKIEPLAKMNNVCQPLKKKKKFQKVFPKKVLNASLGK